MKKYLLLALAACGGETQLYHHESEVPQAASQPPDAEVAIRDYDVDSPSLSMKVTMQTCLDSALMAPEDYCPRVDGECDGEFVSTMDSIYQQLESIVREEADVNIFDALDGEITIPITGFISSYDVIDHVEINDDEVRRFTHAVSHMLLSFGNDVEAVSEYQRGGQYLFGDTSFQDFPVDHLKCTFAQWVDLEDDQWRTDLANLQYFKNSEPILEAEIKSARPGAPWNQTSTIVVKHQGQLNYYSEQDFDISAAKYAVKDLAQDGIERAQELVDFDLAWRTGVFYWD